MPYKTAAAAVLLAAISAIPPVLANDALDVNTPTADAHLTSHGSNWAWAVFAIMLASTLGVLAWALKKRPGRRAFHFLAVATLATASIMWFVQAANLGHSPVAVEFVRYRGNLFSDTSVNPYSRAVFWCRWVGYSVITPLLLLELLLITGTPLSNIFSVLFFGLLMVINFLIGALVSTRYKWGFYTFAAVSLLYVLWFLLFPARVNAKPLGAVPLRVYRNSAFFTAFVWMLYPIAHGVSSYGNVIPVDSEFVFYGIIDLLAMPVFLIYHLWSLKKLPYEMLQLQSGHWSAYAAPPENGAIPRVGDAGLAPGVTEKVPTNGHHHSTATGTAGTTAATHAAAAAAPAAGLGPGAYGAHGAHAGQDGAHGVHGTHGARTAAPGALGTTGTTAAPGHIHPTGNTTRPTEAAVV